MRRVFTSLTVVVFAVCIIAWCAPVIAQNNAVEAGAVVSHPAYFTAPGEAMPNSVNAFGTNPQWTTLHVYDWTPWTGSATPNYAGGTGYVYTAASGDNLWTQVNIPVGAQVDFLIWLYYDNDPACY